MKRSIPLKEMIDVLIEVLRDFPDNEMDVLLEIRSVERSTGYITLKISKIFKRDDECSIRLMGYLPCRNQN